MQPRHVADHFREGTDGRNYSFGEYQPFRGAWVPGRCGLNYVPYKYARHWIASDGEKLIEHDTPGECWLFVPSTGAYVERPLSAQT